MPLPSTCTSGPMSTTNSKEGAGKSAPIARSSPSRVPLDLGTPIVAWDTSRAPAMRTGSSGAGVRATISPSIIPLNTCEYFVLTRSTRSARLN